VSWFSDRRNCPWVGHHRQHHHHPGVIIIIIINIIIIIIIIIVVVVVTTTTIVIVVVPEPLRSAGHTTISYTKGCSNDLVRHTNKRTQRLAVTPHCHDVVIVVVVVVVVGGDDGAESPGSCGRWWWRRGERVRQRNPGWRGLQCWRRERGGGVWRKRCVMVAGGRPGLRPGGGEAGGALQLAVPSSFVVASNLTTAPSVRHGPCEDGR
jgi:hypothetical protein